MKKFLEKFSVLCLSLILLSTYSVSAALPAMKQYFSGISPAKVEAMVSAPSLAVMCTIIAGIWLDKVLSEHLSITIGLILVTITGVIPVWCHTFAIIYVSRILLGVGLGLTNAHAITIIQKRYAGKKQAFLLGVRGSMETLGGAATTLAAGFLLKGGWNQSFWIYLTALPILILFLLFVKPLQKTEERGSSDNSSADSAASGISFSGFQSRWTACEILFLVSSLLLGALFIFVNTSNTMRLTDVVLDRQFGTAQDASVVLSLLQAVGVIGGIFYGKIREVQKRFMFPLTIFLYGLGSLLFAVAGSLPVLYLGALFSGYGNGLLATILFNRVSDILPDEKARVGTHFVLIGCNLGATSTPFIMDLLGRINSRNAFLFTVYAAVLAILAGIELFLGKAPAAADSRGQHEAD